MISKFSVKKPYTVLVGVLLVIVLGVVSLSRMTTDLLPDLSLQYPMIFTTDIVSILVYTFFSRMFDLMLPPVAKHSIVVA